MKARLGALRNKQRKLGSAVPCSFLGDDFAQTSSKPYSSSFSNGKAAMILVTPSHG
jgi:hypothetical protein